MKRCAACGMRCAASRRQGSSAGSEVLRFCRSMLHLDCMTAGLQDCMTARQCIIGGMRRAIMARFARVERDRSAKLA